MDPKLFKFFLGPCMTSKLSMRLIGIQFSVGSEENEII